MSSGAHGYKVLLVSAAQNMNAVLRDLLNGSHFERVETIGNINAAKRAFAEQEYDFVIINSPLPDSSGVRFAIDTCGTGETVVLLFVRAEFYSEITERVVKHGVLTLSKPTSRQMIETAVSWMISMRERLRTAKKKTLTLEEKMAEIRLVNRAKWLLIEKKGMDEPTAHRYIEKQAMDRCVSRKEIAEEIVRKYAL